MQVESDIPAESTTLKDGNPREDFTAEKQIINGKAAATAAQILVEEEEEENNSQDSISAADFHNNDNKILALLNEAGSNYSFKGLMRKLNLHQQSLSRALHRLEEMELVEKSPIGYRLSKAGASAMSRIELLQQQLQQHKPKGREYMQLLQTYIPLNVKAPEVMRHLIGRWFKNLRWIGMIRSDTGYTLQWTSDDGSFQINLRLIADYIVIETNASTEKEKVQAMVGSYTIYEQITKVMQSRLDAYVLDHRDASAVN
ncbi:MAG TPA: MarR family transcriptional regulator [Nitrososphaera sp.]